MRGDAGLAGAGAAAEQDARSLEIAFAFKHGVEARDAGRHALARGDLGEAERRHRQHGEAVAVDQEGIFIGAMGRAAIFDHPQPPRGGLLDDAVIEHDHAIRDIFLDAIARRGPVVAALGGDDHRQVALLEPGEQAAQFRADDGDIGDAGEQGVDAVEHDAPGVHLLDRMGQAHEQALEIIFAGFLDLVPVEMDMIHGDQAAFFEIGQIKAERDAHWRPDRRSARRRRRTRPVHCARVAPLTRKVVASRVLPQPAPPQTSVGRPRAGRRRSVHPVP